MSSSFESQHCIALGPTNVWIAISNIPTLFLTLLLMSSRYPFHLSVILIINKLFIYLTKHAGIVLHVYMSVCVLIMVGEHTYHSPLHCVNSGG